jgi:predicted ATPase/DNA-binding CsgD family transcriptional regulator
MQRSKFTGWETTEKLTRRERVILLHLAAEKSNREIASLETLSLNSVKWYVQQVLAKLGVNSRSDAVERARALGLLETDYRILRSADPYIPPRHSLPAQLTSFVGREVELAELRRLLTAPGIRLLTLTGSGGTGKTRLALQAARGIIETYPDGVWLVELAPLAEPLSVPKAVITALGLVEQTAKEPITQLEDYLRQKRLLLILDNCEHLVEACARLAQKLLAAAEGLTILATSREILGIAGEVPFRVPPLSFPNTKAALHWEFLGAYEAVRLFVERAQVVSPGFSVTQENAAALAQITLRLDGIPLAIELAAARLRVLSVGQVALRLENVFDLLTGGSRTALPRHQTLAALIEWSYNLLNEAEQGFLRRLSVFAGGWTLDAGEAICGDWGPTLTLLGQLVDKSLVLAEPRADGEMRYRMLETVRQFAHEKLVEAGEVEAVRKRHLEYYLNLVERLEPKLRGRTQIETLNMLEDEIDNLRQALEWALQTDVQSELRLASALKWFWHIRFHWAEGIEWLEKGVLIEKHNRLGKSEQQQDSRGYAKALSVLGFHLSQPDLGQLEKSRAYLEEALSFYKTDFPDDLAGQGWAMVHLGYCKLWLGDLDQARILAEQAKSLFTQCMDLQGQAECWQIMGNCEVDLERKMAIFRQQLAIVQATQDDDGIATAIGHVGGVGLQDGNYLEAWNAFAMSRDHYRIVGNPHMVAMQTLTLAVLSHLGGEVERAVQEFDVGFQQFKELGSEPELLFSLYWRYFLAYAQGRCDQAEELLRSMQMQAQKTEDPLFKTGVLYHRARLARYNGDYPASHRYAEEGLAVGRDLGYPKMLVLVELGYLSLRNMELDRARLLFSAGAQTLIAKGETNWLGCVLDGLALLAACESKWSQAARLFGTRLSRGFFHLLSPIERAEREGVFNTLRTELGTKVFDQLRQEGEAMSHGQVLALMKVDNPTEQEISTPYEKS